MIIKVTYRGNTKYQHCICEVPTRYKTRIAKLLTETMKDYGVKNPSYSTNEAFKNTFKSNLNWAIDELMVETHKTEQEKSRLAIKENNAKILRLIGRMPNKNDSFILDLKNKIKKMTKGVKKHE